MNRFLRWLIGAPAVRSAERMQAEDLATHLRALAALLDEGRLLSVVVVRVMALGGGDGQVSENAILQRGHERLVSESLQRMAQRLGGLEVHSGRNLGED